MALVLRHDAGTLQRPRRTSQGYLRVDGWASRVGIQEYRNPDGTTRRELREDSAVFDDNSLLGFEGAPITDDHPSTMVDIHNAKALTKGTVLSTGRRDGDHVAVSMVITDPDLIRKIESGKRQLSTGYYVELDETPGVHPQFGRYDARQVRVGPVNHLAVVERGRAGTATLRMDSAVDVALDLHDANPVPDCNSRMDLEAALAKITELEAKLDAAEKANAGESGKTATLEAERDAARKDAETAKADLDKVRKDAEESAAKFRKDSEDAFAKALRDGLDVLTKAKAALPATFKLDGKDLVDAPLRDVKCAVVKHIDGDDIPADKHEAYVDGRFEACLKRKDAGAASLGAAKAVIEQVNLDTAAQTPSNVDPEKAALEANKTRISSAWQSAETK